MKKKAQASKESLEENSGTYLSNTPSKCLVPHFDLRP